MRTLGTKQFGVSLLLLIVAFSVNCHPGVAGQNQSASINSATAALVVRHQTNSFLPKNTAALIVSSASDPAAVAYNTTNRLTLNWSFGGKAQRGWQLYLPLINRLIGSEHAPDTADFALALASWQKSAKLSATGKLDETTWSKMIAEWQARRLRGHAEPSAAELIVAPATDFHDASRSAELRQVERQTYAAYKRLLRAAAADPDLKLKVTANGELARPEQRLRIISAYRPQAYQERLRRLDPKAGRAGLASRSPHLTGRTLDLYVGGYDPVSTEDANRLLQTNSSIYRWLVKNADKFGFYPYFYEPWHWEYRGE